MVVTIENGEMVRRGGVQRTIKVGVVHHNEPCSDDDDDVARVQISRSAHSFVRFGTLPCTQPRSFPTTTLSEGL